MLVSLAYLMTVIRLEPYEDLLADRLQMVTSLQIMLNLLTGLVVKLDAKSPGQSEYDTHTVGVILIIMNVGIVVLGISMAVVAFPMFQSREACFQKTKAWCKKGLCCCTQRKRKAKTERNVQKETVTMTASRRRSLALEKSLEIEITPRAASEKSNSIPLVRNPLRGIDRSAARLAVKKSKPRQHHHSSKEKKKRRSTVLDTLGQFRTNQQEKTAGHEDGHGDHKSATNSDGSNGFRQHLGMV